MGPWDRRIPIILKHTFRPLFCPSLPSFLCFSSHLRIHRIFRSHRSHKPNSPNLCGLCMGLSMGLMGLKDFSSPKNGTERNLSVPSGPTFGPIADEGHSGSSS
jgi:hypothetical protein